MQGVERGELALDALVNDSLPAERSVRDAAGEAVPVTLRMLLSHSSEAVRIPVWKSARALFTYAGMVVLALISGAVWACVRWVRRRRSRRLAAA